MWKISQRQLPIYQIVFLENAGLILENSFYGK